MMVISGGGSIGGSSIRLVKRLFFKNTNDIEGENVTLTDLRRGVIIGSLDEIGDVSSNSFKYMLVCNGYVIISSAVYEFNWVYDNLSLMGESVQLRLQTNVPTVLANSAKYAVDIQLVVFD